VVADAHVVPAQRQQPGERDGDHRPALLGRMARATSRAARRSCIKGPEGADLLQTTKVNVWRR